MKKSLHKNLLALTLAIAMLVSVFTISASAAEPNNGVGVAPNTQLWFADTGLAIEYEQDLDIKVDDTITTEVFNLGGNTIQKFLLDVIDNVPTYVISTHPQYFGPYTPPAVPNYDDEANAQYIMHIDDILVLNPLTNLYEKCFANGIAKIPAAYGLPKANPTYLQCIVFSSILNDATGAEFPANWNGEVVYIKIQTDN
ncbi:MAG: hypothetical protein LBC41_15640 [Clostridiales bacterium]|nr:hypothetical protein [Clostridiales bacterium]MDR2752087.1 hypothetical protein [Clostridiales bacterium]